MRQLAAALMLVVGMALIVVGVGSATWWKDSPIVEATSETSSQSGIIATDPGVLELVDDTVRVTARAPGTTVEMVVAGTEYADLWLGEEPHVSVSGLESWSTLATEDPAGDAAPEDTLSVEGSDLFHTENMISAEDSVELYFEVPEGDWTLIALGQDGTTPQLTLSWEREVATPYAIPLSIIGIVILAAGSALFIYHAQRSNKARRRAESTERRERRRKADSTETSVLPALNNMRRDRRAESAQEADNERTEVREETGGTFGAGILPASPRAEELRAANPLEEPAQDEDSLQGDASQNDDVSQNEDADVDADGDGDESTADNAHEDAEEAPANAEGATADEDAGDVTDSVDSEADGASHDEPVSPAGAGSEEAEDADETAGSDIAETGGDEMEKDEDTVPSVSSDSHGSPIEIDQDAEAESASASDSPSSPEQGDGEEGQSTSSQWRSLWGFGQRSDDEK